MTDGRGRWHFSVTEKSVQRPKRIRRSAPVGHSSHDGHVAPAVDDDDPRPKYTDGTHSRRGVVLTPFVTKTERT